MDIAAKVKEFVHFGEEKPRIGWKLQQVAIDQIPLQLCPMGWHTLPQYWTHTMSSEDVEHLLCHGIGLVRLNDQF